MALCINSSFCNYRAPTHLKFLCNNSSSSLTRFASPFSSSSTSSSSLRGTSTITRARRASPRTSRLSTRQEEERKQEKQKLDLEEEREGGEEEDDGFVLPELPGEKPDFWEGPQWNAFGFFVQYQWAFGIGVALIACAIAVSTYNEGATDFKKTPVYKESMQAREFLEQQEDSTPDVFEANPTEEAPTLD